MKLPQRNIENLTNAELMNTKSIIANEIKRRIEYLNGDNETGMNGLGALFG